MILAFLNKKVSPMALTGGILAFGGAMFVVIGTLIAGSTLISLSGTVSAQGTILSCTYSGGSCQPTVSFQTLSGKLITFRSSTSSSTFAPEKSVTVRYHPNDPQDAQIDSWIVNGLLSSIFAGIGLVQLLVGLFLFLFARNHPSADLINHYYLALDNQDYTTAFQHLNPSMKTPQGEPITQAWFIQRAQASDTAKGKVTNHTIRGFRLTSTRGNFTVKVTRGEQSYKVHLHVLKEGDDWKINGFDLF